MLKDLKYSTYPSISGSIGGRVLALLFSANKVCMNDVCKNGCCFCRNIFSCDWLAIFINKDDDGHMCWGEGRKLSPRIAFAWVDVVGSLMSLSLLLLVGDEGPLLTDGVSGEIWSDLMSSCTCWETSFILLVSHDSFLNSFVFSSHSGNCSSLSTVFDSSVNMSLTCSSSDWHMSTQISELVTFSRSMSLWSSSNVSMAVSRDSSLPLSVSSDFDCFGWPVNLSLFLHFALRFWNHT